MAESKEYSSKSEIWITETHSNFLTQGYRVVKSLFSGKSEFQSVDIVETLGHGRMLFNDGLAMVSERDEFVYHEMIAHVPLFVHPDPRKVLVIGGGDGGTAREVLRHESIEKVTMVEIDGMVVDACREHLPQMAKDLDHPKMDLKIADGVQFVAETDEKYDVVLVDSTDPVGPAAPLFGPEFYRNVYNLLTEDGIVVSQGESPFYEVPTQKSLLKTLGEFFPLVTLYNFSNLTYPGGLWSFSFSSKGLDPLNDFDEGRVKESRLNFSYYNSAIHKSAFVQPQFIKDQLEGLIQWPV